MTRHTSQYVMPCKQCYRGKQEHSTEESVRFITTQKPVVTNPTTVHIKVNKLYESENKFMHAQRLNKKSKMHD